MKRLFPTSTVNREPEKKPESATPQAPRANMQKPRASAGDSGRICFECDVASLAASGRYGRELLLASRGIELPLSLHARKSYDHDDAFPLPPFLERLAQRPPSGLIRLVCLPAFALPEHIESGRYWALTSFNPDHLTQPERRALSRPERLFVPSEAHAARLREAKIPADRIRIIEPAVHPLVFNPRAQWPAAQLEKPDEFLFISVISPLRRHGIDLLLRAWVEEFRAGEPVRLILKLSHLPRLKKRLPYEISDLSMRLGALNRMFAPVSILEGSWPEESLAGLIAGSHVFVCTDRLPFTGFRVREALACGVPVIAPASVCAVAHIDEEVGYLVETTESEQPAGGLYPESPACRLEEPNIPALRRRMREAFLAAPGVKRRGQEAAHRAEALTDWENRARVLLSALSDPVKPAGPRNTVRRGADKEEG
ncbi:MAG TPA: hypothetical protein PKM25_03030 [Candidatus Ozemobacteraceae bacterium]|nr:hypothetical protein [Candidatus Ozemobacteraceae bacterium]